MEARRKVFGRVEEGDRAVEGVDCVVYRAAREGWGVRRAEVAVGRQSGEVSKDV